jgi:hypothetical protein
MNELKRISIYVLSGVLFYAPLTPGGFARQNSNESKKKRAPSKFQQKGMGSTILIPLLVNGNII